MVSTETPAAAAIAATVVASYPCSRKSVRAESRIAWRVAAAAAFRREPS
jgi:hypothetical protein